MRFDNLIQFALFALFLALVLAAPKGSLGAKDAQAERPVAVTAGPAETFVP